MIQTLTPTWAVAPFVVYLISIAVLPLFAGAFWEHNRNKLLVAAILSAPVIAYLMHGQGGEGGRLLLHTACDYAAFIALLGALFTISAGSASVERWLAPRWSTRRSWQSAPFWAAWSEPRARRCC